MGSYLLDRLIEEGQKVEVAKWAGALNNDGK